MVMLYFSKYRFWIQSYVPQNRAIFEGNVFKVNVNLVDLEVRNMAMKYKTYEIADKIVA